MHLHVDYIYIDVLFDEYYIAETVISTSPRGQDGAH